MKVAIDTRYDTLEEALAVVALAFKTSTQGATRKPKHAATSGRGPRGQGAALAESEAADTATDMASPSETGSRRRAGATKSGARKTTAAKTATTNAPPKASTTRKTVVRGPANSGTVATPGTATQASASKAPATRTGSKSASATGSAVKAHRVTAKRAKPAEAQSPKPANVAPPGQSDTIRAWARSQGMQVADAGRMSAAVIAAYQAHHN